MAPDRNRIAIVGTGFVGTSIGLALKAAGGGETIVGHDKEHGEATLAKKRGAVDRAEWNLPNTIEGASLVICAVPVGALPKLFENIAPFLSEGAIVTDTATTKRQVMVWAEEHLPKHVSFIGGHPLTNKDASGANAGEAAAIQGATWLLSPSRLAKPEAIATLEALIRRCGATPKPVTPEDHDGVVAAVNHLPVVLHTTMVKAATTSPEWREMGRLAAGGFRDMTKLVDGDPAAFEAMCRANRDHIIRWLDTFTDELDRLRLLIANDDPALDAAFAEAREARAVR